MEQTCKSPLYCCGILLALFWAGSANAQCGTAQSLGTINAATGYSATRTTCGKGNDFTSANTVSCGDMTYLGGEDELLTFSVSASGTYRIKMEIVGGSFHNPGFKLYENCPLVGSTPAAFCWASFTGLFATQRDGYLDAGITYYLLIDNKPGPSCINYTLSIALPPSSPANDECSGAIALPTIPTNGNCATVSVNTDGATASMPGCVGTASNDVWFSFVAPAGGAVNVQFSSSANSIHEIFSGTCGSLTSVKCSDPEVSTTTGLTPGATYYVRVYSPITNYASTMCLNVPPPNDNCANAVTLAVGTSCNETDGYNTGATASSAPAPTCGTYAGGDVWYKLTVPASGNVTVQNGFGFITGMGFLNSTNMEVYSGSCGALSSLGCNSSNASLPLTGLTPGSTLYIRIWEPGNNSFGSFSVCAYDDSGSCPTFHSLIGTETGTNYYEASGEIYSSQTIASGADVEYNAGNFILLEDGFHAQAGSNFYAYIFGCSGILRESGNATVGKKDAGNIVPPAAAQHSFDIFPNPGKGAFELQYEGTGSVLVQLINMQGAVCFQQTINAPNTYVNAAFLPEGLYCVRMLKDGHSMGVKKWINAR